MRLIGLTLALAACACGTGKTVYAGPLDARAVACTVNSGGTTNKGNRYLGYVASNNSYSLQPLRASQPMPNSTAVGAVLFSTQEVTLRSLEGEAQGTVAPLYNCPSGTMEYFRGNGAYDSASQSYATGLQGIGYRVYYYRGNGEALAAPQQFQNTFATGALVFPMSSSDRGVYTTRIDFVATGAPIRAGTILAGNVFGMSSVSASVNGLPSLYRVGLGANITVNAPTCEVKNPSNLTLKLKDVTVAGMNDGTAENAIYVTELQVDCGMVTQSSPTIRLSGNNLASGYPSTLGNQVSAAAGGATGVGLRLWLFNPTAGGTGGWEMPTLNYAYPNRGTLLNSSPTSLWSYKVGASYLRTGGAVSAGAVTSTGTVTFTYS